MKKLALSVICFSLGVPAFAARDWKCWRKGNTYQTFSLKIDGYQVKGTVSGKLVGGSDERLSRPTVISRNESNVIIKTSVVSATDQEGLDVTIHLIDETGGNGRAILLDSFDVHPAANSFDRPYRFTCKYTKSAPMKVSLNHRKARLLGVVLSDADVAREISRDDYAISTIAPQTSKQRKTVAVYRIQTDKFVKGRVRSRCFRLELDLSTPERPFRSLAKMKSC